MKQYDNGDIIKKLIGKILPIGETNEDEKRLENLKELIELSEFILDEIRYVALEKDQPEWSVSLAGKTAHAHLMFLKGWLED